MALAESVCGTILIHSQSYIVPTRIHTRNQTPTESTMTYADRWLLPDGVEEILPAEATSIDHLRRQFLGLYGNWGYDIVIPPRPDAICSWLRGLGRCVFWLILGVESRLPLPPRGL